MSGKHKLGTCPVLGQVRVPEWKGRQVLMDYPTKICPRCKAELRQGDGAFELVRRGTVSSDYAPGLSVALYFCPRCGYIELYDLKVVGRI